MPSYAAARRAMVWSDRRPCARPTATTAPSDTSETPHPQVIRKAIDTVQHEVGRTLQLVVQALLDHAANDRLLRSNRRVEDRQIAGGTFLPLCRKGALHRPDDVAPGAELAQTRLRFLCQLPSGGADSTGQAHT